MWTDRIRAQGPRLVLALALITYGVLLIVEEAGVPGVDAAQDWFLPVILGILAFCLLIRTGMARIVGFGVLVLFLFSVLDRIGGTGRLDIGDIIGPVILVFIGIALIRWTTGARYDADAAEAAGATVNNLAIMAGHELRSTSLAFRGGTLTAFMGGCELDLRGARTAPDGAVLDVFTIWGGVEIRVPRDWTVVSEVMPLMAGFEDKRDADPESGPGGQLTIRGSVIMGGIEIST